MGACGSKKVVVINPSEGNGQHNTANAAAKFGTLIVKCVKGVDIKTGQGMFGKVRMMCIGMGK
jgi:hypothetical protein